MVLDNLVSVLDNWHNNLMHNKSQAGRFHCIWPGRLLMEVKTTRCSGVRTCDVAEPMSVVVGLGKGFSRGMPRGKV